MLWLEEWGAGLGGVRETHGWTSHPCQTGADPRRMGSLRGFPEFQVSPQSRGLKTRGAEGLGLGELRGAGGGGAGSRDVLGKPAEGP